MALSPTACNGIDCKNQATRIILIGNTGYGLCEKCFKRLKDIRQLILEDWNKEEK